MPAEDKALGHRVRKELVKRQALECSRTEIYALKGHITVRGTIRVLRGQEVDPHKELQILNRCILRVPGVREVEFDVRFTGAVDARFSGAVTGEMSVE